jgi:hypothetical protein
MGKVIFGNHSSVMFPRKDREAFVEFCCEILGGEIMKEEGERDFLRLEENSDARIALSPDFSDRETKSRSNLTIEYFRTTESEIRGRKRNG